MERISSWKMYYRNRNERKPGQASRRHSIDGDESRQASTVSTLSMTESDDSSVQEQPTHPVCRRHSSHVKSKKDLSRFSASIESAMNLPSPNLPIHAPTDQFQYRDGRRYLKDIVYPLPSDMVELQRQNLSTLLTSRVLGAPTCVPINPRDPPRTILELGCGGAYWSAVCHDFFTCLDVPNPSFIGLDIVPLAPDLKEQGLDWNFVQHDLRRGRLPFKDDSFDLVLVKDMNLAIDLHMQAGQRVTKEISRILKPGGYIEVQNMDLFIRTILPNPQSPSYVTMYDEMVARDTGTHVVSIATSFGQCQNPYLNDFNKWVAAAMEQRDLNPTPGTNMLAVMVAEAAVLGDFEYKRVAIPFASSLDWEDSHRRRSSGNRFRRRQSSAERMSIRQTALQIIIQWIEALEPALREVSGKDEEEWSRWWGSMRENLADPQSCTAGECLEIGAWWARKKQTYM